MGPPKASRKKTLYSVILQRYDCFEYRYNRQTRTYYMFNPWTGETIFSTETSFVDRKASVWAPPDPHPSDAAVSIQLLPECYASRTWGRRICHKFSLGCQCMSIEEQEVVSATHIAAVTRGWIARENLKKYMCVRYSKRLCHFSGYYYYVDNFNEDPTVDTTWYKPRLAFPNDILEYKPIDLDDYMEGKKLSNMGFEEGPYCRKAGTKKTDTVRAEHIAFLKPNAWRDMAYKHPGEVDLENSPLATIIPFMDELKVIDLPFSDYAVIRSAIDGNNWGRVLYYMHMHSDRILVQLYGLMSFAKTTVPIEKDGIMKVEAKEVFDLCIFLLTDADRSIGLTHKAFAFMALHNLLSSRAGRVEYFNADVVTVQGARRKDAVDEFINERIRLFVRYLDGVEFETMSYSSIDAGKKVIHTYTTPTKLSIDIAEYSMLCIGLMAQNPEQRELLSQRCVSSIMRCILKCPEESGVATYGLRALYNFMYRCEGGQAEILDTDGAAQKLIAFVHKNFQGDIDCMRNCRRFELAIQPDGFRGNVEAIIEKEMKLDQMKKATKPFAIVDTNFDVDEVADAKHQVITFDGDKNNSGAQNSADSKLIAIADAKEIGDHSAADSKASHKHIKKQHKPRLARDMKLDDDDDDLDSVGSDLTM